MRTFTGRRRERRTRASVKWANGVAGGLITFGGVGTIIAVSTVFIFLLAVAWPLFSTAKIESQEILPPPWGAEADHQPIHVAVDEYQLLGWVMFSDGSIRIFRGDTGEPVGEIRQNFEDRELTAWSFNSNGPDVCMGFADGTAQLGRIEIEIGFLGESEVSDQVRKIPIGEVGMVADTIYAHPQPGQFRKHEFKIEMKAPVELSDEPVRLLSHIKRNSGTIVIALAGDSLAINSVSEIRNFLTGEVRASARRIDLPYNPRSSEAEPKYLLISSLGDLAYLAWDDGLLRRYDTRNLDDPRLVEDLDLAPGPGNRLTALGFLIGRTTLVSGDAEGAIKAWFCVPDDEIADGKKLVVAHDLGVAGAEVSELTGSSRSRLMAAGLADGRLRIYHVTANQLLLEGRIGTPEDEDPILAITIGSREDRLLAIGAKALTALAFDLKHPAVNPSSLFTKVWYEGYPEPMHTWQSSSGTDEFEPKYGLMPLIFGTLKATFYSLLFGLPIALLAAIFTSEFLNPKVKSRIKPLVEMMASLPSVVLGFLAALVIAPVVERVVPAVIASFVTLPMAFLCGAYLWQLMPRAWALRLERHRFGLICLMIPVGIWSALAIGPLVERVLFAGNFEMYMDGQRGSGTGGWFILLAPLCGILTAWFLNKFVSDRFRDWSRDWSRVQVAVFDGLRFALSVLAWLAITGGIAWGLATVGIDPRGNEAHNFLGTYVQRNAMVVGFIMGFAIIPIIYTLAEDALSSVPEHLRSASLGAGATPWQTAVRIIIPSAMSGLFSAAMIGLGRAVGETMIVLMAAGNTPVMQMNIFNGFRTLSANIAVEMPEAPVGGTHYRVLFLAALALFMMTFIVNTVAEIVRQRFRKRAYQL